MRLIDANALPVKTNQRKQYVLYTAIEDAPTIDAVPVVHGRWIDTREYCGDYMCSNCKELYRTNVFNYCPNCGARMDGE